MSQDYVDAAVADPVDEATHISSVTSASKSPERALMLALFWSALRDKDRAWVDGAEAAVPFEDACDYLGFHAKTLRARLKRHWPKRRALYESSFAEKTP